MQHASPCGQVICCCFCCYRPLNVEADGACRCSYVHLMLRVPFPPTTNPRYYERFAERRVFLTFPAPCAFFRVRAEYQDKERANNAIRVHLEPPVRVPRSHLLGRRFYLHSHSIATTYLPPLLKKTECKICTTYCASLACFKTSIVTDIGSVLLTNESFLSH